MISFRAMSNPDSENNARLVPAALLLAVCSISFAAIFFRKAAPTHPLTSAGVRLAVAGIILSPMIIRSAVAGRLKGAMLLSAFGAGIAYGVHFGSWVTSLTMTSVAASVTLVTITPLILAVAGTITGRDRPSRIIWISLGVAFAGLLLIGGNDLTLGRETLIGDALALLGAFAIAVYMTIGRRLGEGLDLWAFSGIACLVGAAALLGSAFTLGIPITPVSWESFAFIVLAAILPQLVGHNLLTWSLRYTKPSNVAMAVVGEPVGATALAWLWLGEKVSGMVIAGCAVTLAAVILAIRNAGDN